MREDLLELIALQISAHDLLDIALGLECTSWEE
jgi:hypothetical protein